MTIQKTIKVVIYLLFCLSFSLAAQAKEEYTIGVLAKETSATTFSQWRATADYLNNAIPNKVFRILPLSFDDLPKAVGSQEVDFVITNSAMFVELEYQYGISAIATLKDKIRSQDACLFGGVIFSRADQVPLRSLQDIQNKSILAVDPNSLGGFLAQKAALLKAGIKLETEVKSVNFLGTHEAVVTAIKNAQADIGFVRTDTLEKMAFDQQINLNDFQVLPPVNGHPLNGQSPFYPYLHSTNLYPEWPIAKLKTTPVPLAENVAKALLNMPSNHIAAASAHIKGWTIPANYQPVNELLKTLQLAPYTPQPVTLKSFILDNQTTALLSCLLVLLLAGFSLILIRMNRNLAQLTTQLQASKGQLEKNVKQRTQELLDKDAELETLIDTLPSMVFVKDAASLSFIRMNQTGEKLLGIKQEAILGKSDYDFFPKEQADFFTKRDRQVLDSDKVLEISQEPINTPQGIRYLNTRKVRICDSQGKPLYLLGISNDITDKKQALEELEKLATHDPLTGLFNRRILEDHLKDEVKRLKRYPSNLGLLMIDIDHFKKINDRFSHKAGDCALRDLSKLITSTLRETDFAARYGGEEFIVSLPNTTLAHAEVIAERLRKKVEAYIIKFKGNIEIDITVSIGVAAIPPSEHDWENLLFNADEALYEAKKRGRNQVYVCKKSPSSCDKEASK